MDQQKIAEAERLRAELTALEAELEGRQQAGWPPGDYYATYHLLAGMVLGFIASMTSLIFNIVGSAMFGKHPLELIRIYLTFPLGERALEIDSGFVLAAGCCLYLGTGMIGGIPFHMILTRFYPKASTGVRLGVATVLGLGVWIINYYCLLSWLQPLLVGGSWIVDMVPPVVAAATHVVFGWTILATEQWGRFEPPAVAEETV